MGRLDKRLINSVAIIAKSTNRGKKAWFEITDITIHDCRKLLKGFTNLPCLGYKNKQIHIEQTEAQLLMIR